ncbi:MAG: helicase-related protein [Patescibacteria group bacterium]|nr:helicase-related protein [Patescibacteria group bacterium]
MAKPSNTGKNTDLTFITNEGERNLLERFKVLIKDTEFFDVLVGYFYTSGFHAIYKSLEDTEKIRILIGISTNPETALLIQEASQLEFQYSHPEAKKHFSNLLAQEMEQSPDDPEIEEGVRKFIEWAAKGKLEIKAYPTENLHAKLYIMTFKKGDRDVGRVITGSSNFTKSGFADNLEFNVELKKSSDYNFAKDKFEELWKHAVDVSDKYVETIQKRTWLNNTIKPYELYLKFLYEYFKSDLSQQEDLFFKYTPPDFKKLEYQKQAVLNAKKILDSYGGVFIADVVGLGKTYVAAMLAQQLEGRNLVLAPPTLLKEANPGSWKNVFKDFNEAATFKSIGKLERLALKGTGEYKNVFIDESHRFRNESTQTYEYLAQICRGKRVILVTATPLNNRPQDILSQIKLFQKSRKSTIPGTPNLVRFFSSLEGRLKGLDRKEDYEKYIDTVQQNGREIRERVLKYLMVRRTRHEVQKYYGEDLEKQNFKFPDVAEPEQIFYQLNSQEDKIFSRTVELIAQEFNYARYMPMLYYEGEDKDFEEQGQKNMGRFMKILLIKRLESSFYAFRKSLERFIYSYEQFLEAYKDGEVYVSKKYINKIFELLENDDDAEIQRLIDKDKAKRYSSKDFDPALKEKLEADLEILNQIQTMWRKVNRDPKLEEFIELLKSNQLLSENKLIVFSESKETAEYLEKNLSQVFPEKVLLFTGGSSASVREKVIENFDARARYPKDNYRILISTEVLSEGVNLHRSNVVINYDIPWNPTRLMQRAGRINRVDTTFEKIYTYSFFPTSQANTEIKLKEAAEYKIQMFIEMLGNDARLLTEGEEIKSHDLFEQLSRKETITGEDQEEESELKYLETIRDIRDDDPDLFEKVKRLPKKARTARKMETREIDALLSFMRKGRLEKFYLTDQAETQELDFFQAANILEIDPKTPRENVGEHYYDYLARNKEEFRFATTEEAIELAKKKGGRDSATKVMQILSSKPIKQYKGFTEEDEQYIRDTVRLLQEGGLPKQTTKTLARELDEELKNSGIDPLKLLAVLRKNIAPEFFKETLAESSAQTAGPREVILSEYLVSSE